MTPNDEIILPASLQGRRSRLSKLGRSNALTIALSIGLHTILFVGFYHAVFSNQSEPPRRIVIPEARLAPGGGDSKARSSSGDMPRLNPMPPPPGGAQPAQASGVGGASPLQISELPVVAVNLTGSSNFVVGSAEGTTKNSAGSSFGGGSLMGTGYSSGPGTGGSGMIGPATSFFGASGNAYKIVYVADVSNSIGIYRKDLILEICRSIQSLTPTQEFAIILAKPKELQEFNAQRLVLANSHNKAAAINFIEKNVLKREVGAVRPMEAIERAFTLQPELVYFLTDGDYLIIKDDLIKTVSELYKKSTIKMTVIGLEPAPMNVPTLERIAKETGGFFRQVQVKDQ